MVSGAACGRFCSHCRSGYSTRSSSPDLDCPVDTANPGRYYHWRLADRYTCRSPCHYAPGALARNFLCSAPGRGLACSCVSGDCTPYSGNSSHISGKSLKSSCEHSRIAVSPGATTPLKQEASGAVTPGLRQPTGRYCRGITAYGQCSSSPFILTSHKAKLLLQAFPAYPFRPFTRIGHCVTLRERFRSTLKYSACQRRWRPWYVEMQ